MFLPLPLQSQRFSVAPSSILIVGYPSLLVMLYPFRQRLTVPEEMIRVSARVTSPVRYTLPVGVPVPSHASKVTPLPPQETDISWAWAGVAEDTANFKTPPS